MRTYEADEVDAMLARAVAAAYEACVNACKAEAAIQKESAKFSNVIIDQRDFDICVAAIRAVSKAAAQEQ